MSVQFSFLIYLTAQVKSSGDSSNFCFEGAPL